MISHRLVISGLQIWDDREARPAAGQMGTDEALLLRAQGPVVRFYRWAAPAVTFGYAQRYADVRPIAGVRPAIRRWTGGGMVFHGGDLTIALAMPASHELCRLQTGMVYQRIHEAILKAVEMELPGARLAGPGDCLPGPACFESPALNDILLGGRKICGGALRRGKDGLLYQGSLHGKFSALALGHALCASAEIFKPDEELPPLCARIAKERYATEGWNQMR